MLVPPTAVLSGPGIVYPVFIDPSVTVTRQAWTYVAQNYPDQPYMKSSYNDGHARVGYDDWNGS
jgi:hypothetical protein